MIRLPGLAVIGLFAGATLVSSFSDRPARKAILYLSGEVPLWSRNNGCFSCHNNGDGARALYAAVAHSLPVPESALDDTSRWLQAPRDWADNVGNPQASDKRLAHLQFSLSLAEAVRAGAVRDHALLRAAAHELAGYQDETGCWPVEPVGSLGSPTTYGRHLATFLAIRLLEQADAVLFLPSILRGRKWLEDSRATGTIERAAVVLALTGKVEPRRSGKIDLHLTRLLESQGKGGGWGPYPNSPHEPFDTALAVLALQEHSRQFSTDRVGSAIRRGRRFLTGSQLASGGWAETTRPSGFDSYAQHISTTAWVTLALLETQD